MKAIRYALAALLILSVTRLAYSGIEPERAARNTESKSGQISNGESRAARLKASRLERSSREARIEEASKLHKKMEWQAKIKRAEDWLQKHCNFVLKIRDKILEGIDSMKRSTGKKYIIINGEEYIEKDGTFVKLKEPVNGK